MVYFHLYYPFWSRRCSWALLGVLTKDLFTPAWSNARRRACVATFWLSMSPVTFDEILSSWVPPSIREPSVRWSAMHYRCGASGRAWMGVCGALELRGWRLQRGTEQTPADPTHPLVPVSSRPSQLKPRCCGPVSPSPISHCVVPAQCGRHPLTEASVASASVAAAVSRLQRPPASSAVVPTIYRPSPWVPDVCAEHLLRWGQNELHYVQCGC